MENKLNDKKLILLSCIGLVFLFGLCLILLAFANAFDQSQMRPPVSSPTGPDNVVDISPDEEKEFAFAAITNEDIIEIRNLLGEKQIINLEKRGWRDIKWSPNNETIAVRGLSDRENNVYDIYLFDIKLRNWSKLTNYDLVGEGITSFEWVEDEIIYFKQGGAGDSWIHSLDIRAQSNSIIKLYRVDGEIYGFYDKNGEVLLRNQEKLFVYSIDNTLRLLDSISFREGDSELTMDIVEVKFGRDSEVIYQSSDNKIVISDGLDDSVGEIINSIGDILCIRDTSLSILEENGIRIVDINNPLIFSFFESELPINARGAVCYNNSGVLIQLGELEWIFVEDGDFEVAEFALNSVEIDPKNFIKI